MEKEKLVYMAKIAEQTERFEDMIEYMKKVVAIDKTLNIEERNLLSVAYKNSVGSRRTAWRALSSIKQKEEQKKSEHLTLLENYKMTIIKELDQLCDEVIKLINESIL